jgi:hypothetical protein
MSVPANPTVFDAELLRFDSEHSTLGCAATEDVEPIVNKPHSITNWVNNIGGD